MLSPYNYSYNPDTNSYIFTTVHYLEYYVYLNDGSLYFDQYPDFAADVLMFGFEVRSMQIPADIRVKYTILDILINYFGANRDKILMFICDQSDNRQMSRKRKFNSWYVSAADAPITKIDKTICASDGTSCVHVSVMHHFDNPKSHKIAVAFEKMRQEMEAK